MTVKRIVSVSAFVTLMVIGWASAGLGMTPAGCLPPQQQPQQEPKNRAQEKPSQFAGLFKAANPELAKKGPGSEQMAALRQHVEYLRKLADQGVLILAGHTLNNDETAFGIVIVRADSQAAASAIMDADPLVRAHIVTVAVFPFESLLGRDPQGDNGQKIQQ